MIVFPAATLFMAGLSAAILAVVVTVNTHRISNKLIKVEETNLKISLFEHRFDVYQNVNAHLSFCLKKLGTSDQIKYNDMKHVFNHNSDSL